VDEKRTVSLGTIIFALHPQIHQNRVEPSEITVTAC
jgi:hypothetical protein